MGVELEQSNNTKATAAFVKAQGMFQAAKKDVSNSYFNSKYADLSSVLLAIQEALKACDLAVIQPVSTGVDGHYFISTILLHSSGERLDFSSMRVPVMGADMANAQKVGAAITYARRFHLASALGISQEDDDGNSLAGHSQPNRTPQQQPRPAQPQTSPGGDAPATAKQIEFIKKLAADIGRQPPAVKTSKDATAAIEFLTKAKADRMGANKAPAISTENIPW